MKTGLPLLVLMLAGCTSPSVDVGTPSSEEPRRYEFVELIMASPARIVIAADDADRARRSARAAFDRMHRLERIISSWDPGSESSRLVASAPDPIEISPELEQALRTGLELHRETGGAFDLTTGPCIELWRTARATNRLPDDSARTRALGLLGMESIRLDEGIARIEQTGVRLNFGGIGKGLAVDEARAELENRGETSFLIDFDGELRVECPPPGRTQWTIEIAGALEDQPLRIRTAMMSVSTSGDVHQFVEIDGVRYSHVIDPGTGLGTTTGRQVTVITPEANGIADALATAGCVLEPEAFRRILEANHPGASAVVFERVDERTTITMIGDPPVSVHEVP